MARTGRPTKYDKTILTKADAYFADPSIAGDNIATIAGLCVYLDVSRDTIYEWKEKHADFSDTIKRGEKHQERQIVNLLTDRDRFTAGSIFVAKNVLGWRDKQEVQQDTNVTYVIDTGITRNPGDPR
jgi:hypothetical protein